MRRNDDTYWPSAKANLPNLEWSVQAELYASEWVFVHFILTNN